MISRVAGAGVVACGLALGVAALTGSPAEHETGNAHLEDGVWVNTQGVNTVGKTSVNTTSGNTISGNTVVGLPGPSIAVPGGDASGSTVVWFPGGAIVTVGSTIQVP